jgi:hypothetical protein
MPKTALQNLIALERAMRPLSPMEVPITMGIDRKPARERLLPCGTGGMRPVQCPQSRMSSLALVGAVDNLLHIDDDRSFRLWVARPPNF